MSEPTPSPVAGGPADRATQPLTPEAIDQVLGDFRAWLQQLAATEAAAPVGADGPPAVDLHTLVGQFTALRHEVHLQTRAVRTQQEQNAETLRQLEQALAALEASAPEPDADAPLRAVLRTLLDMHDALTLAGRELARINEQVVPLLRPCLDMPEVFPPALASVELPPFRPSFMARMLGLGSAQGDPALYQSVLQFLIDNMKRDAERQQKGQKQARDRLQQAIEQVQQQLQSVVVGFRMSAQRIEGALEKLGVEPVAAIGAAFDPEQMEVVEVVSGDGQPDGAVIAEVRRGYLWRGRLLRYAQVTVAKNKSQESGVRSQESESPDASDS